MNMSKLVLERLDAKGWLQGRSGGFDGPNCLTGALSFVRWDREQQLGLPVPHFPSNIESSIQAIWRKIICEQFPERRRVPPNGVWGNNLVVTFNDHHLTTFTEVRMVLEKAIVLEDEAV